MCDVAVGCIGCVLCWLANASFSPLFTSYRLTVAKTQDAKKAGVKVSALQMFLDELNEKGLDGLRQAYLRGFTARLLHVCLTTAGTLCWSVLLRRDCS